MRFSNKVYIVTRAGSGIGRAAALRFPAKGGNEAVDLITQQKGTAFFIKCDVGIEDEIKQAVPRMDNGSVVNISSVHAHETTANVIPYVSSKGAMEAFVRGASEEYPSTKVRFNCVAQGSVHTPMLWNNPNVKSGIEKLSGAIGKPEELAAAICFLASDEAGFVNGTTLVADGARLDIL